LLARFRVLSLLPSFVMWPSFRHLKAVCKESYTHGIG
jgi:hypothetical protein